MDKDYSRKVLTKDNSISNSHSLSYDKGITEFNAGGSHESNPNDGVKQGTAPDGLDNKVELDETKYNDYIFSRRLEADEQSLEDNLIDKKYEGKSFADISKKLSDDIDERPNDNISKRTHKVNMERLKNALEEFKENRKRREVNKFLDGLNTDLINALQLAMVNELMELQQQELLMLQLAMLELAQQELQAALQQQQSSPEELQYLMQLAAQLGMFGNGGHIYLIGDLMAIDNTLVASPMDPQLRLAITDLYYQKMYQDIADKGYFIDSRGINKNSPDLRDTYADVYTLDNEGNLLVTSQKVKYNFGTDDFVLDYTLTGVAPTPSRVSGPTPALISKWAPSARQAYSKALAVRKVGLGTRMAGKSKEMLEAERIAKQTKEAKEAEEIIKANNVKVDKVVRDWRDYRHPTNLIDPQLNKYTNLEYGRGSVPNRIPLENILNPTIGEKELAKIERDLTGVTANRWLGVGAAGIAGLGIGAGVYTLADNSDSSSTLATLENIYSPLSYNPIYGKNTWMAPLNGADFLIDSDPVTVHANTSIPFVLNLEYLNNDDVYIPINPISNSLDTYTPTSTNQSNVSRPTSYKGSSIGNENKSPKVSSLDSSDLAANNLDSTPLASATMTDTLPDYATPSYAAQVPVFGDNTENYLFSINKPTDGIPYAVYPGTNGMPIYITGNFDPMLPYKNDSGEYKFNDTLGYYEWIPNKSEADTTVIDNPNPKESANTKTHKLNTYMRYAPIMGSAFLVLSDSLGWSNVPDYSNINMYLNAVDNIRDVNFIPIGGYLSYNPVDREYIANANRAANTAVIRAAYSNANGNVGLANANIAANNYILLNGLGNMYIAADDLDMKNRLAVAEYNNNINQYNASGAASAIALNQRADADRALMYGKIAEMRDNLFQVNDTARAANINALMTNLGNLGRENFVMNQVNSNKSLYYGVGDDGIAYYKKAYYDLDPEDRKAVDTYLRINNIPVGKNSAKGGYLTINKRRY